jgi:prevent-host-death family protein
MGQRKKKPNARNATTRVTASTNADGDPALVHYVYEKRAMGWTFALICREGRAGGKERFPHEMVERIGREYDAKHGKPTRIIRSLAGESDSTGATIIAARDLRNDSARILRQVEAGRRFLITVSGREVAELAPVASKSVFVPRSVIQSIIREAPVDRDFAGDIEAALGQRVDAL